MSLGSAPSISGAVAATAPKPRPKPKNVRKGRQALIGSSRVGVLGNPTTGRTQLTASVQ